MNLNLLLQKSYRLLLAIMLTAIIAVPSAYSQSYNNPLLSLVGADGDWDDNWYPDGRLTLSPSLPGQATEVLVPIFIQYYSAGEKIYTMSFSIKYDKRMFEPISVQTFNPKLGDPKYTDDAYTWGKDFDFTMKVYKDTTFLHYLDITDPDNDNNKNGAAVKIVGISGKPLRNTNNGTTQQFKILCYLRMKVLPVVNVDNDLIGRPSYILFNQDSIFYNDVRITGDPTVYPGLGGLRMETTNPLWNTDPLKPGCIQTIIKDNLPYFDFAMQSIIGQPIDVNNDKSLYTLIDPITVDSADIDPDPLDEDCGNRYVQIFNGKAGTRLNQIQITSDQPWLEVETSTSQGGQNLFDFNGNWYIPFLDNGILGQVYSPIDRGVIIEAKPEVWLHIRCNPLKLVPQNGEMCGTYVGYLTFNSQTAEVNPVRMKVTFIYLRPPYEPSLYPATNTTGNIKHTGIRINIKNTDNNDTKTLVFGVAPRATNGVDALFGESKYSDVMNPTFDARWFPTDTNLINSNEIPLGFRDASPDYDRPQYNSRDIRGLGENIESIIYNCRFTTNKYPLYITWNDLDFPEGAILFLQDAQSSGTIFSVNMREASPTGNANELSYTFTNATLSEFNIVYTLPKVINFVDEKGQPIIKSGWNLLSLPIRPTNAKYDVVYPSALAQPYYFLSDNWQFSDKDIETGYGYFMKFASVLNNNFSGAIIGEIGTRYGNLVRLTEGWNAIGGLSYPTTVEGISFEVYNNVDLPNIEYTRNYSVWGYKPNSGFYETNIIRPGLGYFIKVGTYAPSSTPVQGYYHLTRTLPIELPEQPAGKSFLSEEFSPKSESYANSTAINVRDNAQNESTVYLSNDKNINTQYYEMPPVMGNIFDVRFTNNAKLDNSDNSIVKLNGVTFPVSISMNNADADYFLYNALNGDLLGTIAKNSNNNVEVNNTTAIKVVKGNFDVNVYPNPVASTATVNYTVPADGLVTIKLYDAIGNEVSTVINQTLKAGLQTASINVNGLTSGSYLVKINANGYNAVRTITVVK